MEISHAPITFQNILPTLSYAIDGINDENKETVFDIDIYDKTPRYQVAGTGLVKQYYGYGTWTKPVVFSINGYAREQKNIVEIGTIDLFRDTPEYKFSDELSFEQEGNNGAVYLYEGFSLAEPNGTWTCSPIAVQKFNFTEKTTKNLNFEIKLHDIFNGAQYVTVYFNDVCVYSPYQKELEISFVVPNELILEGEQEIRYELSTMTPSDTSSSTDERQLSVRFKSMKISETDEEPEEKVLCP